MADNKEQVAKNVASSLTSGISTTSSGITAPVVEGQTGGQMSQAGQNLLGRAVKNIGNEDPLLKDSINKYRNQEMTGLANKRLQGLQFAGTIGGIRERIAQAQADAQEKQATAGFVGAGSVARNNLALQRQATNTLTDTENQYLNQLRSSNAMIGGARQSQAQALQGTTALDKAFAQESLLQDRSMVGFDRDQGFFGKIGGTFGKDQTWSGKLDVEKFKANTEIQALAKEFGIDVNAGDFAERVNKQLSDTIKLKANSTWDRDRDIEVDMGDGMKVIGEQEKEVGEIVMDYLGGFLNLAAVAIPVGAFAAAAGKAFTAGMTAVVEDSVAGAINGVLMTEGAAMTLGEAIGTGMIEGSTIQLTTTGVIADSMTAELVGVAERYGLATGEEAVSMANSLKTSLTQELQATLGEEVAATIPVGQLRTALTTAESTMAALMEAESTMAGLGATQLGAGVSVDLLEAVQAAGFDSVRGLTTEQMMQISITNALGVLESAELESVIVSGAMEAAGTAGAEGIAAGAVEGATAGAVEGAAGAVEGAGAAVESGAATAESEVDNWLKDLAQKVKDRIQARKQGPMTTSKAVTSSTWQGLKAGLKAPYRTTAGRVATGGAVAGGLVDKVVQRLNDQGIDDETIQKVLEEISKANIGG